ncbi:Origin recognition complex, subunit 1 [Malassezia vespertilionis]|uniref:Origin recognition complex subunit 1 n=1 Tax=Malassezia vespertilionis TaxID=2020962 RepID=A0A2N1JFI5_9BASI|nr:Origin recognition complex, subunit 1 [Malassezia vespertilionis]PKI85299.1 Orc1p [Malassezia vespertilionis]WFD06081.1 Origin recognition complex, subunit 1 [Malassezia vespertilionis]
MITRAKRRASAPEPPPPAPVHDSTTRKIPRPTPKKRSIPARRIAQKATPAADVARAVPPLSLPNRPGSLHSLAPATLARLSAHERARRLLHVGSTPEELPSREQQFSEIVACMTDALQARAGECAYMYGVPGTGKTATVREAVRTMQASMARGELPAFRFVEINGMKLASAMQAYTELWSAVQGGEKRLHPRAALNRLTQYFGADGDGQRTPLVVLMDELDLFVTSRQDVIYNLFHWPNLPGSQLVVLAVANTMDLPERTLQPKVASRLGMLRVPFMPYTDKQLLDIVRVRLDLDEHGARVGNEPATQGCEHLFRYDALVFASKRVANVSGDARRMLDVCRHAVEAAEHKALVAGVPQEPISIADVRQVLDRMARSGRGAHMAALSTQAKLLLGSMYATMRRSGLDEVTWGDVLSHHAIQ